MSAPVVVIGAGIVGVCTASYLQREGHAVILIDPKGPGEATSFGNAGCLNGSSIVPVAMPGVISKVPGWLADPLGPLAIRWSYLPRLAPWLYRFWRASSPARVEEIARALRPLLKDSLDNYAPLVRDAGAERLVHRIGHLFAYTTEAAWQGDEAAMALRASNGVSIETLDTEALHELEPDLAPGFIRGRLVRENGHTSNPGRLVKTLAETVVRRGGRIVEERVVGFEANDTGVSAVRTDRGAYPARAVVLATGAWSKTLARMLGDDVPLDTERGYHVVVHDPESAPRIPTMWVEGKIIATAMEGGLRVAGQVEFAGLDAPPNWGRADVQLDLARKMYPALAREHPEARLSRWMGFRPSMPDSLPVIGPSTRYANAFHAYGHGHVGMAAGSTTGRVVAEMVSGKRSSIPIEPFSPRRFR
jgi:glycine/D-amino acid oxidase-like deaminating enzyme